MFKKKKYTVIRQAISKDLAAFVANYFLCKSKYMILVESVDTFHHLKLSLDIMKVKNEQIPNTYSQYANMAMETLLLKCLPDMEKATGLKLYPAYSFFYAEYIKKVIF